ncbi:MAG: hypothetical protein GY859_27355 [Desulfobacterales bacterium]|nr:hypothetical protein [Desulfobacterales bacterium]
MDRYEFTRREPRPREEKKLKRNITIMIALLCVLLVIALFASEDGCIDYDGPAHFDNLSVTVDPAEPAKGGEATVKATAAFRGGCCYSLFVRNLAVTLTAPPGIAVNGANPHIIREKEVLGGREITKITVAWTLMVDRDLTDEKITVSINMDGLNAPIGETLTI